MKTSLARFETTRWTLVASAKEGAPDASHALAELCSMYWKPLHSFLLRRGAPVDEAQDLTQEFFAKLIEKHLVDHADPSRGKFRTFLLASFQNFLHDTWDKKNAKKRAGDLHAIRYAEGEGSHLPNRSDATDSDPVREFERQWALTVLSNALERLRQDPPGRVSPDRFASFEPYLTMNEKRLPYAQLATQLGISLASVKVNIHRLRKAYGEAIRDEIADTVVNEEDIEEELRYLMSVLS